MKEKEEKIEMTVKEIAKQDKIEKDEGNNKVNKSKRKKKMREKEKQEREEEEIKRK
ncbi:13495_t:CDS:1, partial [Ambispora gerdemannii]